MADATPKIIKAAQRLKREALRGNDAALRELERAYGAAWRRLRQDVTRLSKLIDAYEAEGRVPVLRVPGSGARLQAGEFSVDMLRREARYHQLMYQMEQELVQFSRSAAAMVVNEQTRGLGLGQDHAQFLMQASLGPPPRGVRALVTWNRVPEAAFENLVGFLSDGSPLAYKFAGLPGEIVAGVKGTFEAGFAAGWNPRRIAREVKRAYDGALVNAQVTVRTEYMRAYRTAAHETYRANSDIVTGWIWLAAKQARTCAACWAKDGQLHPLSERLVDHPAGRCTAIPCTRSWAEVTGRDIPGVKETSAQPWDSSEAFGKMGEADQRKVLGPTRYALWKEGKIELNDMATLRSSSVWGDHYQPTSVKELVASGKVSAEDVQKARTRLRPHSA